MAAMAAMPAAAAPLHGGSMYNAEVMAKEEGATAFGAHVLHLSEIDAVGSSFKAKLRLFFKFHVPNIKDVTPFKVTPGRTYYLPEDLMEYLPGQNGSCVNSREFEYVANQFYGKDTEFTYLVFHADPDPPEVLTSERVCHGVFDHHFDLMYFPQDVHKTRIRFVMYKGNPVDYKRVWYKQNVGNGTNLDLLQQPDYEVLCRKDNLTYEIEHIGEGQGAKYFEYWNIEFEFWRKPGFYIMEATVPLSLVALLTPTSYEIPLDDIASRLGTGTTLLLAAVAIKFVVSPSLPKVSYLTGIDLDTAIIYGFLVSVIMCQVYLKDYDEECATIFFHATWVVLAVLWRTLAVIIWRYVTRARRFTEAVIEQVGAAAGAGAGAAAGAVSTGVQMVTGRQKSSEKLTNRVGST
jgi:hypothetical protein